MRAPPLSALLVLVLLSAGCASSPGAKPKDAADGDAPPGAPQGADGSDAPAVPAGFVAPAEPGRQTFHLLEPYNTTFLAPNATEPAVVPKFTTVPLIGDTPVPWNHTFVNAAHIAGGEAVVWVRVTQYTLHSGVPTDPVHQTCTWWFRVWTETSVIGDPCLYASPAVIAPGDYELRFPLNLRAHDFKPGEEITFHFLAYTSSRRSDPTVFLLTNSTQFDSRVELESMREPVPPAA